MDVDSSLPMFELNSESSTYHQPSTELLEPIDLTKKTIIMDVDPAQDTGTAEKKKWIMLGMELPLFVRCLEEMAGRLTNQRE